MLKGRVDDMDGRMKMVKVEDKEEVVLNRMEPLEKPGDKNHSSTMGNMVLQHMLLTHSRGCLEVTRAFTLLPWEDGLLVRATQWKELLHGAKFPVLDIGVEGASSEAFMDGTAGGAVKNLVV
ncbi:hypothetical protein SUGI_0154230 [Cryptomeria japonica]|nr:hypothetical protein SUGI_0154230 [Cryptomeria japonica]